VEWSSNSIIVAEVFLFGVLQLATFAFFIGRLTERVKAVQDRLDLTDKRVERLEEKILRG
jgi:hypothetical protein